VVTGSEKLPAIKQRSCTTIRAMRRLVSVVTAALANSGMTTEACMLKASAVVGQPLAQRFYLANDVRSYLTDPPSRVLGRDFGIAKRLGYGISDFPKMAI
jgi:hypothetical protein